MKSQIIIRCIFCFILLSSCASSNTLSNQVSEKIWNEIKKNEKFETSKNTGRINTLLAQWNTENALIVALDEHKKSSENPYTQINYAQALLFHGNLNYTEQENAIKAIEILRPLASTWSTSHDSFVWTMLGYWYEMLEDYDNAISCYNSALLLKENDPVILAYKWQSLRLKGEIFESEKTIELAYSLDSKNPFIAAKVWHIYFSREENEKAKKIYEYIIEESDNTRLVSEAYYTLWNYAFINQEFQQAHVMYEKSIDADAWFDASYTGLARSLFIEQMEKFQETWISPDPKQANKPFELLSKALEVNTKRTLSYYVFAQMYFSLWEYDLAQEHLILANKVLWDDLTLSKEERVNMQRDISILWKKISIQNTKKNS